MSNEEQRSWHQNTPTSPIFCTGESNYYKFEVEGPSFPSHNEDTTSSSLEERKETPRGELEEDGVKGDSDSSDKSKQQKRIRSAELHNHNERLRRQTQVQVTPQTMISSPAPFLQTLRENGNISHVGFPDEPRWISQSIFLVIVSRLGIACTGWILGNSKSIGLHFVPHQLRVSSQGHTTIEYEKGVDCKSAAE